jgi:hypothetical protein
MIMVLLVTHSLATIILAPLSRALVVYDSNIDKL